MQRIDDLLAEILTRIQALNISITGITVLAGVHKNTLRNREHPEWSPNRETIRKLQSTIELLEQKTPDELNKYLNEKNILPPRPRSRSGKRTRKPAALAAG